MKRLIILIWLLLVSITARSQFFSGGLIAGLTSNQIDGDGLGGFDHSGMKLGFFAERNVSKTWMYRIELLYVWRGASEADSDTSTFYKAQLHTISIPVVLGYTYRGFTFEAGLAADIIALAQEENIYGDFESDPEYNTLSLGGTLGLGYAFTDHFRMVMRSDYSITPIRTGRIVNRPPGLVPDLITGQRAVSLSLSAYFYF